MRIPLRAAWRSSLAALLALAAVTCTDQPTEPGAGHAARVRFAPTFAGSFAAGLPLDNVTVTVVRPAAETLTVVNAPFAVDDSTLQLDVAVDLLAPSESLEVTLELRNGVAALFRGTALILVSSGAPGAPPSIPLAYVGPGADIASIYLTPRDSVLAFGDTLTFAAAAADSFEASVGSFYLRWSTGTAGSAIRADGRIIAPNLRATVWIHAVTPTGIADSTQLTFTPVPTQLSKSGGDLQNGPAGDTLLLPLTVLVRAADNLPVKGVAVTFAVVGGGGSVVDTLVVTDSLGLASTRAVLGVAAGSNTFSAAASGVAGVNFGATGGAGAPAAIAKQGGDAQSDTVGQALAPFVARVTDANSNPVAGVPVVWTRVAGTGSLSADTVLTNASGDAAVTYTLGAPGIDSVSAQIAGTGASVIFSATAVPGGFSIVEISGNGQVDTVGRSLPTPMVAEVHLQGSSTPAPGVMVQFSILYGGGSLSVDSALSDSLGRVQVTYTLDTLAGAAEVMAATPTAGQYVTFQIAKLAAAPHHLAFLTPLLDTVQVGVPVVPAPVVEVRDTFNNPVPVAGIAIQAITNGDYLAPPPPALTAGGIQFSGSVVSVDSVLTDSTGKGTFTGLTLLGAAGSETLRFRVPNLPALTHLLEPFTLVAGAPVSVIAFGGNGQTAFVDSLVAVAPQAYVVDTSGNGVPGVPVTFVVTAGGGSVTGSTPTTDSLGYATVGSWRLGSSPGADTLEAQVNGAAAAVFHATAQPLTPTIILQLLGTSVVGVGRSAPLEVRLSSPAPVGGIVVSFASDAPSVVGVDSATVAFNQNDTLRYLTLTGVGVGTANILADAPGYVPDTLQVTGSLNLISLPTTLNVPYGANTSIAVTLGQPAPAGGVVVALISSDSTKVGIVTPTVNIPQGQTSANGTVHGTALGTATVAATNPNYAPDASIVSTTATLNIVNASQTIYSTIPITQTLEFRSAGALIAAPAGGVVASLASLDTTCVTVPATATIPAGLSSTTFTPTYGGTAPLACSTKVLATYPGVDPDSISITVNPPPGTTIYGSDVGSGLATNGQIYLATGVPTARNVVVRSLDPTKVFVATADTAVGADSAVFAFTPGASFTYYYIRGKEGIVNDSAQVQVTVPGYASSQVWIRVRAPGVVSSGVPGTTTTFSTPAAISAYIGLPDVGNTYMQAYQPVRPGGTLNTTFTFTVVPSTVATLMKADSVQDTVRTATLVPGAPNTGSLAQGGVQYIPVGAGSSTVTVSGAGYLALPPATATTIISAPTITVYGSDVGSGLATNGQVYLQTGVPTARNVVVRSLDTTKVFVATADTAVGADSAVFAFPVNGSFTYYYIRGKEGIVNDSALVQVDVAGYTSSQVWIRVRAPGAILSGVPGTTTTFSAPAAISAYIGLPSIGNTYMQAYQPVRPGGTLNTSFTFTVAPSAVATLMKADSVQDTVRSATLVPGQPNTGNLAQGGVQYIPLGPGSSSVSLAAAGYLPVPGGNGTTSVSAPTTTLYGTDVGSGLATSGQLYLQTGVPTARNVVVRSLDTTKVLVAVADTAVGADSAVFAFPVNGSFTYWYIRGKDGIVNDSALVQVTVPGYTSSQVWVRVRQPGIVLSGVPGTTTTATDSIPFSAYIGLPDVGNTYMTSYQPVRPGGTPLSALFKVSTPGVGRLATSSGQVDSVFRPILVGQYNSPGSVAAGGQAFKALTTGIDTVQVTAPGYVTLPPATQVVTVSTPGITVYSPGTVGAGLQANGQIYLGANRHGGVWVKVESSNPGVALIAMNDSTPGVAKDSIFLADGQTFTYFWVQGVDSTSGTPIITVSANGFVDATTSVTIVQPGIVIGSVPTSIATGAADAIVYGYVGVPNAGNTGLNAYQNRRPGAPPLVLTFTTTDPTAATLVNSGGTGATRTAAIGFRNYNTPSTVGTGGVALRPVAVGSAVISAATPGFIPQSTASATVSVTP